MLSFSFKSWYAALLTGIGLTSALVFLGSCSKEQIKPGRSFCYWETRAGWGDAQLDEIKSLGVKHLYLHYFDVVWSFQDGAAMPAGELDVFRYPRLPAIHYSPSIFIDNKVFKNLPDSLLDALAGNTAAMIEKINLKMKKGMLETRATDEYHRQETESGKNPNYKSIYHSLEIPVSRQMDTLLNEILIDCDWTPSTQKKFFRFLVLLQKKMPEHEWVATIRLWQYKDTKTPGVPPVKKGLLMCYGLQEPGNYGGGNPISSAKGIEPFLKASPYPLPLDVALPLFCWRSIYRAGNFKGMLTDEFDSPPEEDANTWKAVAEGRYICKTDTVIGNHYLRTGDELKVDLISKDELVKIAELVKKHVTLSPDSRITFFSWTTQNMERYGQAQLESIYQMFDAH